MTTEEHSSDVLEAGAALGEPVADEREPKERVLKGVLIVIALIVVGAVVWAVTGPTMKSNVAIGWAAGVLVLLAVAGFCVARLLKLRKAAVALFEGGFVHAAGSGELEAIAWDDVKLGYLQPGKKILLQLDDGGTFTLRAPARNFAQIEKAVRKGLGRDKIRRGNPPKNLAAV